LSLYAEPLGGVFSSHVESVAKESFEITPADGQRTDS
jgi:hypothetical protein